MKTIGKPSLLITLLAVSLSCATELTVSRAPIQQKLIEGAYQLSGNQTLIVHGKKFPFDCTGAVQAIYYYAGIDLTRNLEKYQGNGVSRLYYLLRDKGLLYRTPYPQPGDIIFWDNTYDRNSDGRWNDNLTHVGMVVETGMDGTIRYIHHNYTKGIVIENMNLLTPHIYQKKTGNKITTVNSPLRMKQSGVPHADLWLAGQLFNMFGQAYRIRL